jgi:histidinol dehydrogenase
MTAGFAQAAGVPEILAATPCGRDGSVNPALLYALKAAGVTEAIKVGGAQAIAALALGTRSIRSVDRIFGPGNSFVVEAKRQLVGAVSIDLLPGPSEILILADHTGNPHFIAADILAQAEHGGKTLRDRRALPEIGGLARASVPGRRDRALLPVDACTALSRSCSCCVPVKRIDRFD